MDPYEEKLKKFIEENKIRCEHLHFEQSCHSVEDAMRASGASREDFKNSEVRMWKKEMWQTGRP